MTTVSGDDEGQNIHTVHFGKCNELTSVDKSKYEEKRQNALFFLGKSI